MFIVGIEDRHADVDVYLFHNKERAIEFARDQAAAGARGGEFEENNYEGWVYHATYSCEGDCAWVVERNPVDTKDCEHDYPGEWDYTYNPAGSKTCRKCGRKIHD